MEKQSKTTKMVEKNGARRSILAALVMVTGLVVAGVGAAMLIGKVNAVPGVRDAEYLVSTKGWAREDQPGVIWEFTEIGKGKLTTNNHTNDYDFKWAIEDGRLLIETDWLYELENEYVYSLDQAAGVLTLDPEGKGIRFVLLGGGAE
ncbi:hypothetical protein IKE83_00675 [Candidatus Saccharibacteria bacterium]|nr:hypothetical protein [Candidatus Saccharibacteria bacterium]